MKQAASAASLHATALERAARTARKSGAAKAIGVEDEARAARAAAVAAKPVSVRRAQLEVRLQDVTNAATRADEALAAATARAEAAHSKADNVRDEIEAAKVFAVQVVKPCPLLAEAQHLLDTLERGAWRTASGSVGEAPDTVLDAMRALHAAVAAATPPPPKPTLDTALPDGPAERVAQRIVTQRVRESWASQSEPRDADDEGEAEEVSACGDASADAEQAESVLMELESLNDDVSDAALAAIARRLKRARAF